MRKRRQYQIKQYGLYDFDMETREKRREGREINIAENQITELIQSIKKRTYNEDDENKIDELIFVEVNERIPKFYIERALKNGVIIDGKRYIRFIRSSSMARQGTIAFINEDMYKQMMELISLGKIDNTAEGVISKIESYLGLAFSTTMFTSAVPKNVCIVDADKFKVTINDYVKSIKNDEIIEGKYNVDVELFDGQGLHSVEYGKRIARALGLSYTPTGYQIRMLPSIKGMTYEIDFKKFYRERNIEYIEDYTRKKWKVSDLDAIWTTSMFKFSKYFQGWDELRELREKYYSELGQNLIGISSYSSSKDNRDKMTKTTYQYLQALSLEGDELIDLSYYTKQLVKRVYQGDRVATMVFLGLLVDTDKENSIDEENMMSTKVHYAISKNIDMINDPYVQSFLQRQLKRVINDMKLGKIYINGQYSFTCQDPVLMMEMIAGLDGKGSLERGEFYSTGTEGTYASFRSPLTHSSEVGRLNFIHNEITDKWMNRYRNIIVLNGKDITAQQHSGSDFDGDTFMWTKDSMIINSIIHNFNDGSPNYPVIDVHESENRAKAIDETYTIENIITYDMRTLSNKIGEITNIATYYANKSHKDLKKHDKEIVYARLIAGEEIDYVKHGIRSIIPPDEFSKIKKYKPRFLQKYNYNRETNYQKGIEDAPLNVLCRDIEEFEKELFARDRVRINKSMKYLINNKLVNENLEEAKSIKDELTDIYKDFKRESSDIFYKIKNKDEDEIRLIYDNFYDKYYYLVNQLSENKELLSSMSVYLNYKDSNDSKIFPWICTWEGLSMTIERTAPYKTKAPIRAHKSELENLPDVDLESVREFAGKFYKLKDVTNTVSAINFIEDQYKRKIEKELKRDSKNFNLELETALYGFNNRKVDEVVDIIKNKELNLGSRECESNTYASLFVDDEYICAIRAKSEEILDTEFGYIDLKSMRNKVDVEIIEKFNNSLKVKLKLVS